MAEIAQVRPAAPRGFIGMTDNLPPGATLDLSGFVACFRPELESALMNQLSNKAVEQKTLSAPLLMAARQQNNPTPRSQP